MHNVTRPTSWFSRSISPRILVVMTEPVAATGSVITAKILSEMEREDHDIGLVTLCIGGGQGIAMLIARS